MPKYLHVNMNANQGGVQARRLSQAGDIAKRQSFWCGGDAQVLKAQIAASEGAMVRRSMEIRH
jgi:hypothetical protein